ncbi:MAG: 4Fe-4S binding protein [Anaerolineaceae bacterium]|nr:4Fe-4S binding protein [Anaerolineaceae bacterium]
MHRVIPVRVAVKNDTEVAPFESVSALVDRMQSWGVIDCICRTQKALIGDPCQHPVDVCMVLSEKPDAFSSDGTVTPLDRQGALNTLQRAADAGLVHCVSNNQQEMWYICNCCTCSCAILRGMAEKGIANVVARSAYINRVDEDLCIACGECVDACPFKALSVDDVAHVREITCTGCGLCITVCPQGALSLEHRADFEAPPETEADWRVARRNASE